MAKARGISLEEVASVIEVEGLGYAVQIYLDGNKIEDKDLGKMWNDAKELLNQIEQYVMDNAVGGISGVEDTNDEEDEMEDEDLDDY